MQTYHTRPMPQGWTTQLDVEKLATREARFEADLPLADLAAMPQLANAAGLNPPSGSQGSPGGEDQSLHAAVNFGSEGRWSVADIALKGALELTCQRCLKGLALEVDSHTRVVLVESEEESREVPDEFETALAPGGLTTVAALVAEELLLSLPIVPLHDTPCAPAALTAVEVEPEAATVRPFKDLRALMKGE
jgi:uncharacterized protein